MTIEPLCQQRPPVKSKDFYELKKNEMGKNGAQTAIRNYLKTIKLLFEKLKCVYGNISNSFCHTIKKTMFHSLIIHCVIERRNLYQQD